MKKASQSFWLMGGLEHKLSPYILEQTVDYSTVTALARLRGWSTSVPLISATW